MQGGLCSAPERANGRIGQILYRQATVLAYVIDFRLLAIVTLCCVPSRLLFRKGRAPGSRLSSLWLTPDLVRKEVGF